MFNCIIFTKDRACQLDLLLRSIRDHFKEYLNFIFVIYKSSNEEFRNGYNKIFVDNNYGLKLIPIVENNFREDFLEIVNNLFKHQYTLTLCDDNVIIRKPNIELLMGNYTDDVASVSLRMNPFVNYCYPANLKMCTPNFIQAQPFIKWDWTKEDPRGDWGYPHPVNINIYRAGYFKELVNKIQFKTPSYVENGMNLNRDFSKPYMISELETTIVDIPNTTTQAESSRSKGNSLLELNNKFLNDYIIDTTELYKLTKLTAIAFEFDFKFVKG